MNNVIRKDIFNVAGEDIFPGLYRVVDGNLQTPPSLLPDVIKDSQYLITTNCIARRSENGTPELSFPRSGSYIQSGDIIQVQENNKIRVLLSQLANSNTLLVTERCDNKCVFCSQPPKNVEDDILLANAAMALIAFNSPCQIGISGGEPLQYGDRFVRFLESLSSQQCQTPLHILTNGRALADLNLVTALKKASKTRLVTFGIPLYSHSAAVHDYLVGAKGAFQDTVAGIINAAFAGFSIELRFIPTKENYMEIPEYTHFVVKAFPFIDQLSIMNMEPKGWARNNWKDIYVSPFEYAVSLKKGIRNLKIGGINMKLFNFPLCHLESAIRSYAEKSISDWKNIYLDECLSCKLKPECCGFFSSKTEKFGDQPRGINDEEKICNY